MRIAADSRIGIEGTLIGMTARLAAEEDLACPRHGVPTGRSVNAIGPSMQTCLSGELQPCSLGWDTCGVDSEDEIPAGWGQSGFSRQVKGEISARVGSER